MIESMALTLATPGVYTVEQNAFPNSVVAVATAVPAFVGYTPRADYKGKSYLMKPVRITSMNDFNAYFSLIDPATPVSNPGFLPPGYQYSPTYSLTPATDAGDVTLAGTAYDVLPDPGTLYYLYNSIRLFFLNGGGTAYVVSVGPYGKPTGKPLAAGAPLVNPNIKLNDLTAGLKQLETEVGPTMIVIPDANLLAAADNSTLMQSMLSQAGTMGDRVALLDVQAGLEPDPVQWANTDIPAFRTALGMNNLNYGAAYYPYLKTTLTQSGDVDYNNAGGGAALAKILPDAASGATQTILQNIQKPPATNAPTAAQNDEALLVASPSYALIQAAILDKMNTLPPSGAMAGVYTMVDNTQGVWKAPANVSLNGVTDTTLKITDSTQAGLNVDALTGKSINAIRMFPGKGVIVWGARTLMGNSQDWRYINVRRTLIMIEQSIQLAAQAYVFEANTASTWSTVASMLTNFLTGLWTEGALAGASPADAFSVAVGLGTTMTAEDILNGRMNISVKVAITHPAEFIVITYTQQMQKS